MTEIYSKSRQRAEIAFGKTQAGPLSRDRVMEEADLVTRARDEKTARLREARLAKEDEARANMPKSAPRAQKP